MAGLIVEVLLIPFFISYKGWNTAETEAERPLGFIIASRGTHSLVIFIVSGKIAEVFLILSLFSNTVENS